jgi:hypothetical protein
VRLHKAIAALCAVTLMAAAGAADLSDVEVREHIIKKSIDAYDAACPCPYSKNLKGNICGDNSAWSREGGIKPICYPDEVSDAQVRKWRARKPSK